MRTGTSNIVLMILVTCGVMASVYIVHNESTSRHPGVTLIAKKVVKQSKTMFQPKPLVPDAQNKQGLVNAVNGSTGLKRTLLNTNLIIVTYMRSGSSLTGNMFEYHPDVFYMFEPMHELKWIWRSQNVMAHYLNKSRESIATEAAYGRHAAETVRNIFNCNFENIDVATLSQMHYYRSKSTKRYFFCIQAYRGVSNLPKCIPILKKRCRNTKVRLVKTIEFPMAKAEGLVNVSKSVKVIHLIRDPRATIHSEVLIGRRTWSRVDGYSREHCTKLQNDLQVTARLQKTFPSNIRLVLFEDLSSDPVNMVKSLYEFAGLNFTSKDQETVESFTSATTNERCPYCTVRSNSSVDSMLWRKDIELEYAKIIDENCKEVYQMLGYLPVDSETLLRDLSRPLKRQIHIE